MLELTLVTLDTRMLENAETEYIRAVGAERCTCSASALVYPLVA